MTAGLFVAALSHDRAVVLGSLSLVVLLAWIYLLLGGGVEMEMMDMGGGQMMAMPPEWTLGYSLVVFVMSSVMMVAMMLPSAAPVTLLIDSVARERAAAGSGVRARTALFVVGYLSIWIVFAAAATTLQWALDEVGLLSETIAFGNVILAGTVLARWGISMGAVEGGVPATLPLPARFPSVPLARQRQRALRS